MSRDLEHDHIIAGECGANAAFAALARELAEANAALIAAGIGAHRCRQCLCEKTACGPQGDDGAETLTCPVCRLRHMLAEHITASDYEIDHLRAIIASMPATADGVLVLDGMTLFSRFANGPIRERVQNCFSGPMDPKYWYSTREACAEASAAKDTQIED